MAEKVTKKTEQDEVNVLDQTLKDIEKIFGKGSIMCLGDKPNTDVGCIKTGSISLDRCLGIGGYPKGRIIEIFGPESSGKTTLALQAIANVQKEGGRCAFIDAEHAIDPEYATKLGVNIDELILSQPDYGEQALEIVDMLAKSNAIDLIVVDSVAALVPKAEIDGSLIDTNVGAQARLMSKALRKLTGQLNKSLCTVLFLNQLREKVGVMFGSPETTSGGRALKFYASVRIDMRRTETLKDGDTYVGNVVTIKVVKNKVAPPFKTCKVEMIYGEGISYIREIINLALGYSIIDKSGSWYSFKGDKIGQGSIQLFNNLKTNQELFNNIEELVLNSIKNNEPLNEKKMR